MCAIDWSKVDWSLVTAIMSAIAAVAAAVAAFRVPHSAERLASSLQTVAADRDRKLDCLRRVVAFRSTTPTPDWLAALNEVAVTFNDVPSVIEKLTRFEIGIRTRGGHDNDELMDLIEAMMSSLGLSTAEIDREFMLRPFGGR